MKRGICRKLAGGKRKNQYLLRDIAWEDQLHPAFRVSNIMYDMADKIRGLTCRRTMSIALHALMIDDLCRYGRRGGKISWT